VVRRCRDTIENQVKNRILSRYGELVAGLIWSSLLTFLYLRSILLNPGVITYGDVIFPVDFGMNKALLQIWDYRISGLSPIPYLLLYYPLALLSSNTELVSKSLFIGIFILMGFSACYMTFYFSRRITDKTARIAIAISASTVFMYNPWVYVVSYGYLILLLGYALAPLILTLFAKMLESKDGWRRSAITGAILLAFASIDPRNMIFTWFLLFFYTVFHFIVFKSSAISFSSLTKRIGVFSAIFIALIAYSIIPLAYQFITTSQTVPHLPYSHLSFLSSRSELFNVVRLGGSYLETPIDKILFSANPFVIAITLTIPIFALLPLLSRRERESVLFFAILALLALALGAGLKGPVADLYIRILTRPELSNLAWLFREPFKVLFLLGISYAYLSSLAIGEIVERLHSTVLSSSNSRYNLVRITRRQVRKLSAFVIIAIFVSSVFLASLPMVRSETPALPVTVPKEYSLLGSLAKQGDQDFKVLWLPYDRGQFRYLWAHDNMITSLSTLFPLASISPTTTNSKLLYYFYDALARGDTSDFGKLISVTNTKYVIFHKDYEEYEPLIDDDPRFLLGNLQKQSDLKIVGNSSETLRVFGNDYVGTSVFSPQGSIFVIGGLDAYNFLCKLKSFRPTDWALFFTQEGNNHTPFLTSERSNNIILMFDSDLVDLIAGYIQDKYWISYDSRLVTNMSQGWAALGNGNSISAPSELIKNFAYGHSFIGTVKSGSKLDIHLEEANSGTYALLVRPLHHQSGGTLRLLIDGTAIKDIDTNNTKNGFQWVGTDSIMIDKGSHVLTLMNLNGENVLGGLVLLPETTLQTLRQNTLSLIRATSTNIGLVFTDGSFDWRSSQERVSISRDYLHQASTRNGTRHFFVPEGGEYNIFLKGSVNRGGYVEIAVDSEKRAVANTPIRSAWVSLGPTTIEAGEHSLKLITKNSEFDEIMLFLNRGEKKRTDDINSIFTVSEGPNQPSVTYISSTTRTVRINSSKPFLLVLAERYDPQWSATVDGKEFSATLIYSLLNGFPINATGKLEVTITFKLQNVYTPVSYFSLSILTISILYLVAPIATYPIKKAKIKLFSRLS
jgi:hypothetical protein